MTSPQNRPVVKVLIASPLEPEHVERIQTAEPARVSVLYAPDLLPTPRYPNDHGGEKRTLTDAEFRRWREFLSEAEVSFDFDWDDPCRLLERAPNLRWIQATSAGIGEYVQRIRLPKDAIRLTTAAGVHAQALAEFVLLGMLYFARDMPGLRTWQMRRHWERYSGRELSGSQAMVLGLGHVGRRVATLLDTLGVSVIGLRRTTEPDPPPGVAREVGSEEIDDLLPTTQTLIIATPYTPATHHLIDARRLALLPDGAVLVNVGRGKVVDESALIGALQTGRINAALDVFELEPLPADSPLWDMPNVIISPHSASTVDKENRRIVELFIENLRRYLDGRPLLNVFDYDRQY
jgi:phosphoglycerate dehydrogenase-like enzyme